MSMFSIGVSGLKAAQVGITTSGNNVSNATTDGYSRQEVSLSQQPTVYTGGGYIGQGVSVDTIRRQYDDYLGVQVVNAQRLSSYYDAYNQQIEQINNILADENASVMPSLQKFFQVTQGVSAAPADPSARSAMISSAETLASQFQAIDQRFTEIQDGVNSTITGTIETINSLAKRLADVNLQIASTSLNGSAAHAANDLLDKRDNMILELNKCVQATAIKQSDGSMNIFIGNGQPLVIGTTSQSLSIENVPTDPLGYSFRFDDGRTLTADSLGGGTLGGLAQFQSETLSPARNRLGRLAIEFSSAINDQLQAGIDLKGMQGAALFSSPQPQTFSSREGIALQAKISSHSEYLSLSDYSLTAIDSTTLSLTRISDGKDVGQYTVGTDGELSTQTPTDDQKSLSLKLNIGTAGGLVAGDKFLIRPTILGAKNISVELADPSRIAAAKPLVTATSLSNLGSAAIKNLTVTKGIFDTTGASLFNGAVLKFGAFDQADNSYTVSIAGGGNLPNEAVVSGITQGLPDIKVKIGDTIKLPYGDGFVSFAIAGVPREGDQLAINVSVNNTILDNSNIMEVADLQSKKILDTQTNQITGQSVGASTFSEGYAELISRVGAKTQQLTVSSDAQKSLLNTAVLAQQSVSGVNLDEEAANLLKYQQLYQASSKVIQMATDYFQTVLGIAK